MAVAQANYRGVPDLVLLVVDPSQLKAELRYEQPEPEAPLFPHLYGPLNVDAVVDVLEFEERESGFVLPQKPCT